MNLQLVRVISGCIAIMAINFSGNAAAADSAPAPVASAAPVAGQTPKSVFADYQPFREEKLRSWKEANQDVADHPGMGSMGSMGSMKDMPGMESKSGDAPKGSADGSGHDMSAMKVMSGMESKSGDAPKASAAPSSRDMAAMKGMPGMESKSSVAPKGTGHDMGSMKNMPGMRAKTGGMQNGKEGTASGGKQSMKGMSEKSMPEMTMSAATMNHENHGEMAMAKPAPATGSAGHAQNAEVIGTATVQGIDKANAKLKLAHDPIAALGWPRMTMFFRLKDSAFADRVKEGDKIEFTLEKSATGYVISDLKKSTPGR